MKKILIPALAVVFFLISACGGGENTENHDSENHENDTNTENVSTESDNTPKEMTKDDKIAYIKEKFNEIESKANSYTVKNTYYEGVEGDEETGQYYVYSDWYAYYNKDGELVKLVEETGEEGWFATLSYYYDKEKLFFVFHEIEFDGYAEEETRVYVYDGQTIDAKIKISENGDGVLGDNRTYQEVIDGNMANMYVEWAEKSLTDYKTKSSPKE